MEQHGWQPAIRSLVRLDLPLPPALVGGVAAAATS
jgi:hypothetical protein